MSMRLPAAILALGASGNSDLKALVEENYPAHYVVHKISDDDRITIDGVLDEPAWLSAPTLANFLDLAGPRFKSKQATWQRASRGYAKWITGSENPTTVKVLWDDEFLYIGTELKTKHVSATVTGHCADNKSPIWDTAVLPYFDDDFEVFLNPSQDNYFYTEFEVNANNATYETLWSLPQAGLGSVAPECGGPPSSAREICCNTTWNGGKGLCDVAHTPVEKEGGKWTMEMYDESRRPGNGMQSAIKNNTQSWVVELRFPILSSSEHGGVINLERGSFYPGTDPHKLSPNAGRKFWAATFANALHAPWWHTLTAEDTKDVDAMTRKCKEVIASDQKAYGFSQFLIDANNAAATCYYEASSQNLYGHQYMHNPDVYGYLQFTSKSEKECRNVQWLSRFALAQIYQAEIQFVTVNDEYTSSLEELLTERYCKIDDACDVQAMAVIQKHVDIKIKMRDDKDCPKYSTAKNSTTDFIGGPCFTATASYDVQSRTDERKIKKIRGEVDEARRIHHQIEIGQSLNDVDSDWLCLDAVEVLKPSDVQAHAVV